MNLNWNINIIINDIILMYDIRLNKYILLYFYIIMKKFVINIYQWNLNIFMLILLIIKIFHIFSNENILTKIFLLIIEII